MPHLTEMRKMELFLLPTPAADHLTSTVEVASRLLDRVGGGSLSVTVLVMTTPAPCLRFETESCILLHRRRRPVRGAPGAATRAPHLKAAAILRLRASPAAALVIAFFATTMIDVAIELGIPATTMIYLTGGAATLALLLHAPTLHEKVVLDGDEAAFFELLGMSPIPARWMPALKPRFMILNTFFELDPSTLEALVDGVYVPDHPTPLNYTVVSVLGRQASRQDSEEPHCCIKWLDEQLPASVVLLCLGNISTFFREQLKEMATGLESSGHRLLWSLRGTGDAELVKDRRRSPSYPSKDLLLHLVFLCRRRTDVRRGIRFLSRRLQRSRYWKHVSVNGCFRTVGCGIG
ncbi:hypothetical protein BHM03_00011720, partial [Ensete ventricosum]